MVREEKREILVRAKGPLGHLDRILYADFPTVSGLRQFGWEYEDAPNTIGDWGFFNQWLEDHDYSQYDAILSCHDDTLIRKPHGLLQMAEQLIGDGALIVANGTYPQAPSAYVRGSFEFFSRELLNMLGGKIPLGNIGLRREGKTDSPAGLEALSEWNNSVVPLRNFMMDRGLENRVAYLSPYYRISEFAIEAERGFLHYTDGAPWSFEDGLRHFGLSETEISA